MIRELTSADLPKLMDGAATFYEEGKMPGPFCPETFVHSWTGLLTPIQKADGNVAPPVGLMLGVEDQGEILGAIAGTIWPDLNTRKVHATELFWFVKPGHRGHGVRLLLEFEKAARERGADRIWMVHLIDLNDAEMANLYARLGYRLVEKVYWKDL